MTDRETPVVVVVPGDLHLTEPDRENFRVGEWVVHQANTIIRPDFVQFIGDNVQHATETQFRLFDALRGRLEVPHFALVGDHDVHGDPWSTGFQRHLGDTYGAHSVRGFRFIRLNTQEARPVGLSPSQVEWFREEVDTARARNERVIVFQHNYPYQIWEDFAGPGIDEWRAIVQTRRVAAIVCGHTHYWQVANDGRNVSIATRSIGDPEGGEPGYTLLYFRGDDLAATYRSVSERGPVVLITHPRERIVASEASHVVRGADRVVARIWHESGALDARYRIDGGPWHDMEPGEDGHWSGPLAGDLLEKGDHQLEVLAAGSGSEGRHTITFVVDPTGRYTAVPDAWPRVASTAFC